MHRNNGDAPARPGRRLCIRRTPLRRVTTSRISTAPGRVGCPTSRARSLGKPHRVTGHRRARDGNACAPRPSGAPAGVARRLHPVDGFAWKVPGGSRYLNVPDVTVLAPGWQRVGDWHVDPPPLLLVEVASPSTGAVDRGRKLADYRLGERVCTCWSTCLVLVALARWALRPTTSTGTGGWPRRTQSSSWSAAGRSGLISAIAELPLAPHPGCRPQTRLRRDGGLPHHASRFILPPPGALRDRRPARGGSACRG